MSATYETANNEILGFFKAAWDPTGLLALYPNVQGTKPSAQVAWARVTVSHGPGGQTALTGGLGSNRFDRFGLVTVQIFIPNGQGLSQGYILGKVIADAFEGKSTTSAIWFRNVTPPNEIGPSVEWFQINVTIEFEYDEIK